MTETRPLYWVRIASRELLAGMYIHAESKTDAESQASPTSTRYALSSPEPVATLVCLVAEKTAARIPAHYRGRVLNPQECDFVDDLILGIRTFKEPT